MTGMLLLKTLSYLLVLIDAAIVAVATIAPNNLIFLTPPHTNQWGITILT